MHKNINFKKIAFCITCMNRIEHLKATLYKNIQDNYLLDDVEFVLLDYNSADGLTEWVANNFSEYIKEGILTYYKTFIPETYNRSHSRNMAFKLANSHLVCNLDADNFLGEGFASFLTKEFAEKENIFYSSNHYTRDVIGRVCVRKKDFLQVRGYNEIFEGYGFEDVELIFRLRETGLKQILFNNPLYYGAVQHAHEHRLSQENAGRSLYKVFLSHISPDKTRFIVLKKGNLYESGFLIDNAHINSCFIDDSLGYYQKILDDRFQIVIENWEKGIWSSNKNTFLLKKENAEIIDSLSKSKNSRFILTDSSVFYEITDQYIKMLFSFLLTGAKNIKYYIDFISSGEKVNKSGYGKGIVYKNFNFSDSIEIE